MPMFNNLTRTGLALMAVERDDAEAASEQYEILKSAGISMLPLSPISGHRVLGLLATTMGRNDDADAHFEDSLAFCRKAGARPELAWTSYDYAVLCEAQGQRERATDLLNEARSIATDLGMKPLSERVPNCGHYPMQECPPFFATVIESFLRKQVA